MLVGREMERGRIDALLEDASAGRSGALVLRGEPGIGKSVLLRYARDRADGMLALSTKGFESEADLAFAGLHELLRPLLEQLDAIPPPQAVALSAALALGPPVPGDRFAVAAATLSLLTTAAKERPVLVLVDDVPWLDSASGEALRFALRGLGDGERIATLVAAREGEASALDGAGLPELALSGLDVEAARALVPDLAPDVAARLVEATRGNPLALEEIPAMLTEAQASGAAPLPEPLPASVGIVRAFERRLAALPSATTHVLVVAAASEREEVDVLLRALPPLGLDAGSLDAAEQAGVITVERGRLEWRHPLLRSTAYHCASSSERRRAHRALAEALPGDALAGRAWHLAAAAPGLSEEIALELERAALDARSRRGFDAAARAFERAAELSPRAEARARRLLEAAHDFRLLGHFDHARALLEQTTRTTRDPLLAADAALQRGMIEMWSGDPARARALLLGETEQIEPLDRGRAAAILIEAGLATQMQGVVANTLALSRRAVSVAAGTDSALRENAGDLLLSAQMLAGEAPPPETLRLRLKERASAARSVEDSAHVAVHVGHMLVWIEEYDLARRIFERELADAYASGSLSFVPYHAACLCEIELRAGRFPLSRSAGESAVRTAEETDQLSALSFGLVSLARVEAVTGRSEESRARALQALELAQTLGVGSLRVYGLSVLGLLELGLGRPREGLTWLEPLSALVDDEFELRDPSVVQWRSDLIEAQALTGQPEAARASLAVLDEEAARTERAWAKGVAARCRGMLVESAFEQHFEESVRLLTGFPFERARTELRLGERLRRSRRPIEARAPLRTALASFEALGAAPWAERARAELAATGARAGDARPRAPLELTPQELRIARLVAEGATNKEAAAQLFLSPKTVGYHLGKVYAKLGIHSRAELVRVFVLQDSADGDRVRVAELVPPGF